MTADPTGEPSPIADSVRRYYDARLAEHGVSARGVDWNSEESQHLRFGELARVLEDDTGSLLDFGCGYGAMLDHLRAAGWRGEYTGVDLSQAMIDAARRQHPDDGEFVTALADGVRFDFVVASGVFNVRIDNDPAAWAEYVDHTLATIDGFADRAWAVNMLTSYSDADRMRPDLFYADPRRFFDLCMRNYSRKVAILHDYGLYEFTLMVRR